MSNTTQVGVEYLQATVQGVSVIIPCKNEELAVRQTVENAVAVMGETGLDFEIIVVDDGSTDNTSKEAIAAGAHVVTHNINMGYGASIMDGVSVSAYSVIAIMDADGTYPIEILPHLINDVARHDMVIGERQWTPDNTSLLGKIFRKALYYTILYVSSVRAPDFNSGLRVFRKLNILDYRAILCPTFSFTTSLTLLYLLMGKSVSFLPIEYGERIGHSKVAYFRDALKTFSYVFMITSLFQAYRLAAINICLGFILNFLALIVSISIKLSFSTQVGLHITVSLVSLVVAIAMATYPMARYYLEYLHEKRSYET